MGAAASRANEHGAEASANVVPGTWPSDGESSISTHHPTARQGSGWVAETFVDGISAEIDLCADRAGFIMRKDIMDHIPDHIKRRIMHPTPELQARGFEDLFVRLNSGAETLRSLVIAYFYDTLPLREHLKRPHASPPNFSEANQGLPGHQLNPVLKPVASVQRSNSILASLNVQAAAFNSYENAQRASCFKGTRNKLLEDVRSWMNLDNGRRSIFVLYGVAGIGKSTVAKTVAEHAADINVLGASFFFSRNEETRKTAKSFFPTLAYHLARYDEDFARRVNEALEKDPDAAGRSLAEQFHLLIAEPIQLSSSRRKLTLIVIDALDECEEHVEAILSLLVQGIPRLPRLKVFITARPERHIRNALDRYSNHEQFCLHDIEGSVVEGDIRLYLDSRLSEEAVQNALPELMPPWQPTQGEKDILVDVSGKLFIIASTAAAFILDAKRLDPDKQLATLLDGVSRKDFSGSVRTTIMDQVYMQILRAAQPDPIDDWVDEYRRFVGAIVLLHEPLPVEDLARLFGTEVNDVIRILSNLHSILAPGKDRTFRVHHKSFPDFITNHKRCETSPEFYIDPRVRHMEIARCCLRTMDHTLKFNMCGLEGGDLYKDRDRLQDSIQNGISRHVAYACIYWASHLVSGLGGEAEFDEEVKWLVEHFATEHLLTWLEVLSVVGRIDIAYRSLNTVYTIVERVQNHMIPDTVREILYDGCRFVQLNMENIKASPMNVYYSALPFTPRGTALSRTHKDRFSRTLEVITGTENTWTPLIAVLQGHSKDVRSVAFSTDSLRLASASDDQTVQLWDSQTGAHIATLEGHYDIVNSVVFSTDGSRLASISGDRTVHLWDGRTGTHITTLETTRLSGDPYFSPTPCITYSADGLRLAAGFRSNEVLLWDIWAGVLIGTLGGHSDWVNSVVFSVDGSRLASASDDKTARLWDGKTGAHVATLQGHLGSVTSVIFSPDDSKLASASSDTTVKLWDRETGAHIATLQNHSRSRGVHFQFTAIPITFSADGANFDHQYCLGAFLLDLNDPSKVIARTDVPIMIPTEQYELSGFFGNVVFTNGHIVDGDTITIYYGASDEFVCGAKFSIKEIFGALGV